MVWKATEVVLGAVFVALALRNVFDTAVVPGETRGALRVARRLLSAILPLLEADTRRQDRHLDQLAPSVLMAYFVTWMAASAARVRPHCPRTRKMVFAAGR